MIIEIENITKKEYDELIEEKQNAVVLFTTEWDDNCKILNDTFDIVSEKNLNTVFIKAFLKDNLDITPKNGVSSAPTMILYNSGIEVSRRSDVINEEDFENWILKYN